MAAKRFLYPVQMALFRHSIIFFLILSHESNGTPVGVLQFEVHPVSRAKK
jgi:hypothetical protein